MSAVPVPVESEVVNPVAQLLAEAFPEGDQQYLSALTLTMDLLRERAMSPDVPTAIAAFQEIEDLSWYLSVVHGIDT